MRRAVLLAFAVALAACGSEPGDGETRTDVATDTDPGDAGADVSPDADGCTGTAPECLFSCNGDVGTPGVCVDGAWQCPDDTTNIDDCPPLCAGDAPECCDAAGAASAAAECVQGLWVCIDATTSVDSCCPGGPPLGCLQECGGDVLAEPVCDDGTWTCPGEWADECDPDEQCGGFPPPCCPPDGSSGPVAAECASGAWICPDGWSFDVCNPVADLIGTWREIGWILCEPGGPVLEPDEPIEEIVFSGSSYTVTWTPFETYIDYAGAYTFDEATGRLTMDVEWGNYIPSVLDHDGFVTLGSDADQVRLNGLWLGAYNDSPVEPGVDVCGHLIERY